MVYDRIFIGYFNLLEVLSPREFIFYVSTVLCLGQDARHFIRGLKNENFLISNFNAIQVATLQLRARLH
jgi:hypothetical protein